MFEFSLALKYLLPKRKQLSVALVSLMSVTVISVIVWLLLVFLSVTEGLENNWLSKLTSLNAPLRINPTEGYFSSYYYKIDSFSQNSNFENKTLGEKLLSKVSDPFDPDVDMDLSSLHLVKDLTPKGELKDPVKSCFAILNRLKNRFPDFTFQEYELGGGSLKIELSRENAQGQNVQSFLNQVSYITSFADQSPFQRSLLQPPTPDDVDLLLKKALSKNPHEALFSLDFLKEQFLLEKVETLPLLFSLDPKALPEKFRMSAVLFQEKEIPEILLCPKKEDLHTYGRYANAHKGVLLKTEEGLFFQKDQSLQKIQDLPLPLASSIPFKVLSQTIENGKLILTLETELSGSCLQLRSPYEKMRAVAFKLNPSSLWKECQNPMDGNFALSPSVHPIALPKSFYEKGARIGDRGTLSYGSLSASSMQEQRLPIVVIGFYDPGIIAIGNNCLLASKQLAHRLAAQTSSYAIERTQANGIQVWFSNLGQTQQVYKELKEAFQQEGIAAYFHITPYYELDIAKDVLQQFSSDKLLFTLVGIIILAVACCNIISLLNLLVNDKKKEIAILQALGASKRSLLAIFSFCGFILGTLSCLIGIGLSYLTLAHIESIIQFLTWVQGYNPFNALFYGTTLPSTMSHEAVFKVLLYTPLLSLIAGFIPALRAIHLSPSTTLRSE